MPTKTPVRLPASRSGTCPASSSASHATSSRSRCCGSIRDASRGEMPKNFGVEPVDLIEEAAPGATGHPFTDGVDALQRLSGALRRLHRRRRRAAARTPTVHRRRGTGSRCR